MTLLVAREGSACGTVTIRPDGPHRLNADVSYAAEIEAARAQGHRVGEVTRLAVDCDVDNKEILASLFHGVHLLLRFHHRVTHFFIEVNPRHVPFYRRTLGFFVAGDERLCPRVLAPSILLQARIDEFGERVGHFCCRVLLGSDSSRVVTGSDLSPA
jgi:hypothetical protein